MTTEVRVHFRLLVRIQCTANLARRVGRDKVTQVGGLSGCENLVCNNE